MYFIELLPSNLDTLIVFDVLSYLKYHCIELHDSVVEEGDNISLLHLVNIVCFE